MRLPKFVVAAVLFTAGVAATDAQVGNTPGSGFTTIIGSAMRYVMAYEQKFALLVAAETYVQELQRPPNPGDNLSQRNPGGGMRAGGAIELHGDGALGERGRDALGHL